MSYKRRLESIQNQLQKLAAGHVRVIAVSKTHGPAQIRAMLEIGQRDFGENRQNEARDKFPLVKILDLRAENRPIYHHIGALQSSAARQVVGLFDFVHGVSSRNSLDALIKAARKYRTNHNSEYVLRYLIQLGLSKEASKSGGMPESELQIMSELPSDPACVPVGFMSMGPTSQDLHETRRIFKQTRQIRDQILPGGELSMGMSGDWQIAVEEGATMIRLGSVLFGTRGKGPWKPDNKIDP